MKSIRWISASLVTSGVMLLSGCVAVPGSYGYDSGYDNRYYSQPYYGEPAPVVVAPSVYLQGGTAYDRGYYNRSFYDGRPGYGRPRNDGPRGERGDGPRGDGGRPNAASQGPRPGPPPRVTAPQSGPLSPIERNNVRLGLTPSGQPRD